eukprot:GHRR01013334.1.p1 GENE.GHRR01013334.1~~GHRR01013334.1.p1  ORF type:complete len:166 (-),score=42.15 GHRR01013334.1:218-715(-)
MALTCSRAFAPCIRQSAASFAAPVRPLGLQRVQCARMSASAKQVISTDQAPAALGPYSQAIKVGNTLYISGQIGLVPGTKDYASEGVEGQAAQVMKNMGAILRASGADYPNVVKTTILLADMGDFAAVNGVYGKYFPDDPPARSTFAVKALPLSAKVEIEAIAAL